MRRSFFSLAARDVVLRRYFRRQTSTGTWLCVNTF
jgi:hypothetical protein